MKGVSPVCLLCLAASVAEAWTSWMSSLLPSGLQLLLWIAKAVNLFLKDDALSSASGSSTIASSCLPVYKRVAFIGVLNPCCLTPLAF